MPVGYPDYYNISQGVRPVISSGMSTAIITFDVNIPANTSIGPTTLYTVPAGYSFYMSSADVSSSVSCLQRIEMYENMILRLSRVFDVSYSFTDSDLGIIPKPAGVVIKAKMFNNANVSARFTGAIWGTLVRA